jgi:hypothetical protein
MGLLGRMTDSFTQGPVYSAAKQRLVILADWLPPDFGAVGQYMLLRARGLAERGHDVTLVGLTSGADSVVRQALGRGRLAEIRLRARPVPRTSLLGRLAWTIWTNLRLLAAAFHSLRKADGILFTGSPPFLIHLLAPTKPLWKGRLTYRITDFHPECLIAAQARPSRALVLLQRLTNVWRRRIDDFEVLGEDQWRRLREVGIPDERISLARDGSPIHFSRGQAAEPLPAELLGKCVLLYSGNFGVAHELETVAQGYQLHHRQGSGRVHLWLNATGVGAGVLSDRLSAAGTPFFRSAPVPLERLAAILLSADAHLITLKDDFVGFVMPSKIYACLESRRPLLFVGSQESDIDLLARRQPGLFYWRVGCGDALAFAQALERLADLQK